MWVRLLLGCDAEPPACPSAVPCQGGVICHNAGEGGSCRTRSSPEHLPRDSASLHQRGFNPPATDVVQRKGIGFNKRAKEDVMSGAAVMHRNILQWSSERIPAESHVTCW